MRCALTLLLLTSAASAETVRIGVFGLFHPKELEVCPANQPLRVRTEGTDITIPPAGPCLRILLRRNQLFVQGRHASQVSVTDAAGGPAQYVLIVPAQIKRQFRGGLRVTTANNELLPVVEMDLQTAVASAVAAEAPPGAPFEALKALAVASRSYFVAGHGRHSGFDFCDTTHCQFLRQAPAPESAAYRAAEATRGLVLVYRGATLPAMYSASCSGRTRSLIEVGINSGDAYPYYSVPCAYCQRHPEKWSSLVPAQNAASLASSPSEVNRVRTGRELGWAAVPSNTYQVVMDGDVARVVGTGKGHGVGLCERGAAGMAAEGASFQEILQHYFPNTQVAPLASPISGTR